ncbi:MAG TPA: DNA-binding domain-containing protein [Terrimicrobiaceae bacterium]
MAGAIFRPLTSRWRMQSVLVDGRNVPAEVAKFIKPNDRLSSFERLEIYNRQYWFRLLDCLYDDYPGLLAVLGERRFLKCAGAYLARYPSDSFSLRDLGSRLEQFLREEPHWMTPREELALDMVRFEWAQVVAFDALAKTPITPDEILDTPPDKLRLALQPYITLLDLRYAVDDFLIALKKRATDGLRTEASNAMESMPKAGLHKKRFRLPTRANICLAVHRHENRLYFKRLEPEAYAILLSLSRGVALSDACLEAIAVSKRPTENWVPRIQAWFQNWAALGWLCRA